MYPPSCPTEVSDFFPACFTPPINFSTVLVEHQWRLTAQEVEPEPDQSVSAT